MKNGLIALGIGAGLLALMASRKPEGASAAPVDARAAANAAALNSPAAADAMRNIERAYGSSFANQLNDALNTSQTAGEVLRKLGVESSVLSSPIYGANILEARQANAATLAGPMPTPRVVPAWEYDSKARFIANTREKMNISSDPARKAFFAEVLMREELEFVSMIRGSN